MPNEISSRETARRVLRLIRGQARDGLVSASVRDLAAELSVGRSTANRAVTRLLASGEIRVARKGSGHLYPTTYLVEVER